MDRKNVHEKRLAFIALHGGKDASRRKEPTDAYFLMPDGARVAVEPLAENLPPPADRVERLKLLLTYRQIILRESKADFEDCKTMVSVTFDREHFTGIYCGPNYTGSRDDALNLLRQKRNAVWNAKYAVDQVQDQLDAILHPPDKLKEKDDLNRQLKLQHSKFMDEFKKIST